MDATRLNRRRGRGVRSAGSLGALTQSATHHEVIEIRSYNLKPGTRDRFHQTFLKEALPMLKRWKVDIVSYGPSQHDQDSYFLMRGFEGVAERQKSEDAFYGSDEWKQGPRERILADIDSYTTIVVRLDAATINGLRKAGGTSMPNQASAGSDLDLLTRLNADYITSVQNGDVKRFNEILADDFLCSMADGSLIDRKRFLEVTAQPVTIRNLAAHDVNIRLLGDMAIIHAATSFTAADGRRPRAGTPTSGRSATGSGWPCQRTSRGSSIRGVRVAIVGGPGVGKSTLVRQLADLYHNGSYGEGEKGVWDERVLEDIAAGVNAVGVTEYFARLYDANYRDAAEHDGPGRVIFFEGARITLEAHMAEYPRRRARRATQGPGDRRRVEPGTRDRADLEHRHHREAHPSAQPRTRRRGEHGAPVPPHRW